MDIINAGGGDDTVIYMNTSQKIDGGTGTDILKIIGNKDTIINLAETGSSANQIKIINQDGSFQDATGARSFWF